MPVPIQRIHEVVDKTAGDGNFYIDYSILINNFPKESKKIVTASDEDAELLIKLWATSDKVSDNVYKIKNSKVTNDDILRLKSHGFLTGGTEEIKFTGKAKAVITTMALGESNALQKNVKKKHYTEIIASMSLKGKSGYRVPKIASNYNLIRVSQSDESMLPEEKNIFNESGVRYSFEQTDPSQKKFDYVLQNISSKKEFNRSVWCYNQADFNKLMIRWNLQPGWKVVS